MKQKKIISISLALLMLLAISPMALASGDGMSLQAAEALLSAIDDTPVRFGDGTTDAKVMSSFLCDLDYDGTEELLIYHTSNEWGTDNYYNTLTIWRSAGGSLLGEENIELKDWETFELLNVDGKIQLQINSVPRDDSLYLADKTIRTYGDSGYSLHYVNMVVTEDTNKLWIGTDKYNYAMDMVNENAGEWYSFSDFNNRTAAEVSGLQTGLSPFGNTFNDSTGRISSMSEYVLYSSQSTSSARFTLETMVNGGTAQAVPTFTPVTVDGAVKNFDAYILGGNNYFKLRDVAYILNGTGSQFEVEWDGAKNAINMTTGSPYTVVGGEMAQGDGTSKTGKTNSSAVYINGQPVTLTAFTIGQNNYFKLRDLGTALGFTVDWDSVNGVVIIKS